MKHQLRLFLCALQFLTRLPVPALPDFEPAWITRAARYFPLAGQLVGALSAGVLLLAAYFWSGAIPPLLAVATGILITGAFHEDGLADTIDGFGGGRDPAQRLAIMKDSRIGTYGTLALVLCLSVKVTTLAALPPRTAAIALLACHGFGRAAAVAAMCLLPYAGDRDAARVKPAPIGVTKPECLFALLLGSWPLLLLPPDQALSGVAAGCSFALLMALLSQRSIGGYTGDVLGAIEEVFVIGFLLAISVAP